MKQCPNFETCKLISGNTILDDGTLQQKYNDIYCSNNTENWKNCKRFITKNQIHFCPDFVLPDTTESVAKIIDIFDNSVDNN